MPSKPDTLILGEEYIDPEEMEEILGVLVKEPEPEPEAEPEQKVVKGKKGKKGDKSDKSPKTAKSEPKKDPKTGKKQPVDKPSGKGAKPEETVKNDVKIIGTAVLDLLPFFRGTYVV